MKKCVNGFLIVEGQADKAFLASFLDCEIVVLDGFNIPRRTINYVLARSKLTTPLLLSDPDEAGENIRKRVNTMVPNVVNLYLNFDNRKIYKKHGVAESTKESVLTLLKPYLGVYNCFSDVNLFDLINYEEMFGKSFYELISKKFSLGTTNKKMILQRLKYLNVQKKDIDKALNGN